MRLVGQVSATELVEGAAGVAGGSRHPNPRLMNEEGLGMRLREGTGERLHCIGLAGQMACLYGLSSRTCLGHPWSRLRLKSEVQCCRTDFVWHVPAAVCLQPCNVKRSLAPPLECTCRGTWNLGLYGINTGSPNPAAL